MTAATKRKSLLEVQFPIAQLSLESFLERSATHGKTLNSLGKWWGTKPFVLTRAIILGMLFEAADNPLQWPKDLDVFFRLLCLDSDGMWHRRNHNLNANSSRPSYPSFASLCKFQAFKEERELFLSETAWRPRLSDEEKCMRESLERRTFFSLDYPVQRRYCKQVEDVAGPPEASWLVINEHCNTDAKTLQEWVWQMSERRFGRRLRVGDAFSGMGSIPFEAARLGCDVLASDLNPVAALMTKTALEVIGGRETHHEKVIAAQEKLFDDVDRWIVDQGFEESKDGLRATLYFYCVEVEVPEWDGWKIPLSGTWHIAPKNEVWAELVPNPKTKSFDFKIRHGGQGYVAAKFGTILEGDVVCPEPLWKIFIDSGYSRSAVSRISLSTLVKNFGGLDSWDKGDFVPKANSFYGERLYCIRWLRPAPIGKDGKRKGRKTFVYREPDEYDLDIETQIIDLVSRTLETSQKCGWIPDWRIQDGAKTRELTRTRGWTYWHHLFTPRQLLMLSEYSRRLREFEPSIRQSLILNLGQLANYNARLCRWHQGAGGGSGSTVEVFYNQALNTLVNYVCRAWSFCDGVVSPEHNHVDTSGKTEATLLDARSIKNSCDLWITDPPYADAVKYEELSEFFLAWYKPHIQACFPDWYADSKRDHAVKGDDAGFRVAMSECYANLARHMPDDGLQVLMFTHKDTDVWEDLALIMWSAGLQVKQVWSIATETGAGGIKKGNYVQATYNMVLRKRPANAPVGFDDMIVDEIQARVREVITHMRESQSAAGSFACGYTDTDYLLAAQAVAAEVVTGYASISGVDLDAELRTPNRERDEQSVLRTLMNQAKRVAVDFLVPTGLEDHLRRTPDGGSAAQFWRQLSPEEKFLLKGLEMESGGEDRIGVFQDLGRAYGIADYEDLLGE
ncbi:MAG TPA: DNA methylase, partial [Planctomycetaceae bacterium]|nr:DNA methylase [Planctomycetaceae bacterium]